MIYKNNCTLTALKYAKQLNTKEDNRNTIISILQPIPLLSILAIEKIISDFLETGYLYTDSEGKFMLLNVCFPNNLQYYIDVLINQIHLHLQGM